MDGVPDAPAEPQRRRVAFERFGDRLELRCRNPERAGGCFLVLWLIGWTVGCVFLAGAVLRERQLFLLVFAIPFWASWFFVFFLLLKMFFQREQLVLDREGAEFVRRVILPVTRRLVPLEEIRGFEAYATVVDSDSNHTASGIEFLTVGRSLRFAQGVSGEECGWLAYQLNAHLRQLRGARAGDPSRSGNQTGTATAMEEEEARLWPGETVTVAAWPVEPPSDSRWTRADGFDDLTFVRRGRLSWTAAGGLLFVNLFWNGIVAVFVMSLLGLAPGEERMQGGPWWGLFFFLIPFEAIGLAMFLGLLAVLLEPLRRTSWTFTRQSIERSRKWLGIGPTRTWWVRQLDRIQLCREEPASRPSLASLSNLSAGPGKGALYRLVLIDKDHREFCSLRGLTLGEARWIADTVLRERATWFT